MSDLMTDGVYNEIKDFADAKIRTHSFLFKKYAWLDSYLDEYFKRQDRFLKVSHLLFFELNCIVVGEYEM